jgi:predicted N-acyltransferase
MGELDYVIRVSESPSMAIAPDWDALLLQQTQPTPFMRHAYLSALHESGCASPETGWTPRFFTLHREQELVAACVLYLKDHSYGEYVFDWAWANAYEQHGLAYYPKAVIAVPFTPVPGSRLLARNEQDRAALIRAVTGWCEQHQLSSAHLLFGSDTDTQATRAMQWMERHTVQFHWHNREGGYADFDDFLSGLNQEKRKKIRQERRKVRDAGVQFRHVRGEQICAADWAFFYQCYARTYRDHGNPPYLTPDFFERVAHDMPDHWLMFIAERNKQPIASSLIAIGQGNPGALLPSTPKNHVAYGRYWGALESVDCMHFEACYYQPIEWCIRHGYQRFEGGAQGEHKMARALLPTRTHSTHWLQHPAFADAVQRFLEREGEGVAKYLDHLQQRSPVKQKA